MKRSLLDVDIRPGLSALSPWVEAEAAEWCHGIPWWVFQCNLPLAAEAQSMTRPDPMPLTDLTADLVSLVVESAPDGMVIVDDTGLMLLVNRQMERMFGYDRAELLGQPIEDLLPARFRQAHLAERAEFNEKPRTRPMGEGRRLWALRRDGSEFPVEVSLSPAEAGNGTAVIASVRDVTNRMVAEARIIKTQTELEAARSRQERWLRGLSDIQGALLGDRPVAEALDLVCRHACELSGSSMAAVGQPDDLMGHLELVAVLADPDVPVGTRIAIDDPISTAIQTLQAVVRDDLPDDAPEAIIGQVGSSIIAPLITGGEVIGVLLLSRPPGAATFDDGTVAIVQSFAQHAANALDQARIHRDRQRLAVLEDRERIGRDLHDLVIQRLFAAGMGLDAIMALTPGGPVTDRIEDTVRQLDETIDEIRTTIFELGNDQAKPIATRILDAVVSHSDHLGFDPVVGLSERLESISPHLVQQVLPVLNEALSNVARHAKATAVTVTIDIVGGSLVVAVVDDGIGIGDDVLRGNGLNNLDSRARRLGGTCTAERGSEGGTVLIWRAPL